MSTDITSLSIVLSLKIPDRIILDLFLTLPQTKNLRLNVYLGMCSYGDQCFKSHVKPVKPANNNNNNIKIKSKTVHSSNNNGTTKTYPQKPINQVNSFFIIFAFWLTIVF